jgi:MIP family channel proteins
MGHSTFKTGLAEALGVFLLVFIGGSAICVTAFQGGGYGLLGIAFAHGIALMVGVYMTAGISGAHINPAITFGLAVAGVIEWGKAIVYWIFQLAGAVIGGVSVLAVYGRLVPKDEAPYLGTPFFTADGVGAFNIDGPKAMLVEALMTFILAMTVFMVAVDGTRKGRQMFGICIGLIVTALILIGGPITGAALNPARYFGTAVVSGHLSQLWVYFVGPLLGGLLAALMWKFLLGTREEGQAESQ